jgi:hypothetical protein
LKTWPLENGKLAVFDENFERTLPPRLFPMNELAMDFPSERVDNGYLEILIVAQAVVAEMLCKLLAVRDSLKIAFEVDPDPISKRDAILHIKKELLHVVPQIDSAVEDHERDATIVKGLPRLRAFVRIDVTERFSETAILAGDEPSSISAIKCAVWAAVHFLLPMRTIRPNPARQHSFRNESVMEQASLEACESATISCLGTASEGKRRPAYDDCARFREEMSVQSAAYCAASPQARPGCRGV